MLGNFREPWGGREKIREYWGLLSYLPPWNCLPLATFQHIDSERRFGLFGYIPLRFFRRQTGTDGEYEYCSLFGVGGRAASVFLQSFFRVHRFRLRLLDCSSTEERPMSCNTTWDLQNNISKEPIRCLSHVQAQASQATVLGLIERVPNPPPRKEEWDWGMQRLLCYPTTKEFKVRTSVKDQTRKPKTKSSSPSHKSQEPRKGEPRQPTKP